MNGDYDQDEEMNTSTESQVEESTPEVILPELLELFYKRFYPFQEMHDWLNYYNEAGKDYFARREFNYTIITSMKEEIYVRNQSYQNADDFKREITLNSPHKIDIGAVYAFPPKHHTMSNQQNEVIEREVVFDVDMDEYLHVRHCCKDEKKLCQKCWPFLHIAIQVISRALTQLFDFQHFFFVFSGRRGIHCWVCDKRARQLSSTIRNSILDFLTVSLHFLEDGTPPNVEDVNIEGYPFLRQIYNELLEQVFEDEIIERQDLFTDEEHWDKILRFLPEDHELFIKAKHNLAEKWLEEGSRTSAYEKWCDFKQAWTSLTERFQKLPLAKQSKYYRSRFNPVHSVVLAYTYPRFDRHVSTGLNHLLKSPFCLHPNTGKVCVPIDPENSLSFDPVHSPSLMSIFEDPNYDSSNPESIKKTKVYPYLKYFQKSFLIPLKKSLLAEKNDLSF